MARIPKRVQRAFVTAFLPFLSFHPSNSFPLIVSLISISLPSFPFSEGGVLVRLCEGQLYCNLCKM